MQEVQISAKKEDKGLLICFICLIASTIISVIFWPEWCTISLLSASLICELIRFSITQKRMEETFHAIKKLKNKELSEINSVEIRKANKEIENLKKEIASLKKKLEEKEINSCEMPDRDIQDYTRVFLLTLQKLDYEVKHFGDECSSYVRNTFNSTLSRCGMQFIDYSDEKDDYFDTEPSLITNKLDCTARAIIKKKGGSLILRGHAFVPEK